ncbi:hypothetical protein PRIPAC_97300, partial [Pristionchus pacificus]|uniref:HLH domain-containing protein n=1 Tax=Pristionchus pacificus TaxID=54126 RepID=A0A2A6D1H5_PRIPA
VGRVRERIWRRKDGERERDRRDETGLVLIRSIQSGMGFPFAFPISANLSDRKGKGILGEDDSLLTDRPSLSYFSGTSGTESSISGEVSMILVLLLIIVPLTIDSTALERSHRNALLTFDEWDLNNDCFVTYEEFINYFLDMLFSIRQFEARTVKNANKAKILKEEDFEIAASNITADWGLLDAKKANERKIMKLRLEITIPEVSTVFKIRSVINSTFWHRPRDETSEFNATDDVKNPTAFVVFDFIIQFRGLLSFSEWDLNHDCIVTYDEFKSWVLDMLMTVIKFQALVASEKPDSKDFLESTYESLSRRVIEDLSRLSNQNANATTIIDGFFTRLLKKFEDNKNYDVNKIQTIFKFNSRLNLTFWYNI